MCQRNLISESRKPATTLRRSPRFLQQDRPNADDDTKTPKPELRRTRVSYSDLKPLSSTRKGSLNKSQKQGRDQVTEKAKVTNLGPKSSTKLSTGQRRSTKLDGVSTDSQCRRRSPRFSEDYSVKGTVREESKQEDLSKTERFSNSRSDTGFGRRVKRSSFRANDEEGATGTGYGVIAGIPDEAVDVKSRSDKEQVKAGVKSSEQCLYKVEKRVARSSSRGAGREDIQKYGNFNGNKSFQHVSFEMDKGGLLHEGNSKTDMKSSKEHMRKPVDRENCRTSVSADSPGRGDRNEFANDVEKNLIRMKRKRDEAKEGHRVVQGWTREQELALQRAYFAAKPTPHFWKKVSKMVPGKSAQDCFDKIHSDHMTPPQPQPRSRAKGVNSSSLLFSASKLLNSSEQKRKKPRHSKQKSFISHKAVRELLQKQCKKDQDNEADLFTVLEPTPSVSIFPDDLLFSTPECNKRRPGVLKRCLERSSSAQRKQVSHLNASCGATLTSPPVLKQVRNKALHEKYIDQLHTREAKRKAAFLRATKCKKVNDAKPNDVRRSEVVKAAKDALIFDAKEAIYQFHHQQSMTNNDDVCDDSADIAEDDTEDRP